MMILELGKSLEKCQNQSKNPERVGSLAPYDFLEIHVALLEIYLFSPGFCLVVPLGLNGQQILQIVGYIVRQFSNLMKN